MEEGEINLVKGFKSLVPCFQHCTKQGYHVNSFTVSMSNIMFDFSVHDNSVNECMTKRSCRSEDLWPVLSRISQSRHWSI